MEETKGQSIEVKTDPKAAQTSSWWCGGNKSYYCCSAATVNDGKDNVQLDSLTS